MKTTIYYQNRCSPVYQDLKTNSDATVKLFTSSSFRITLRDADLPVPGGPEIYIEPEVSLFKCCSRNCLIVSNWASLPGSSQVSEREMRDHGAGVLMGKERKAES